MHLQVVLGGGSNVKCFYHKNKNPKKQSDLRQLLEVIDVYYLVSSDDFRGVCICPNSLN